MAITESGGIEEYTMACQIWINKRVTPDGNGKDIRGIPSNLAIDQAIIEFAKSIRERSKADNEVQKK